MSNWKTIDYFTDQADVLTKLALATYPDGSTPDVSSVVRTSTFLFAAGQEHHGSPGDRRFDYEPTWILRGLTELHIEFEPAGTLT